MRSGTTGLPKPAVVSWWKATGACRFAGNWMGLRTSDRYYTAMPLYHSSATLFCLLACLQCHATICLSPKFSSKDFFNEVRSSKATAIQYVGETCRYLLNTPPSPLDKQHNVRLAFGNGLRGDIWKQFRDRFGIRTIAEFYGATECPIATWNYNTGDYGVGAMGRNGSLLTLLLGAKIAIVDINIDTETIDRDPITGFCRRSPPSQPGELICRLDEKNINDLFQGYYNNEKASNSKILRDVFVKGDAYLRTGDVVNWQNRRLMMFNDRIGETYRFKSENVSTTEVSNTLNKLPFIADSCVYGVAVAGIDGNVGVAAIVLRDMNSEKAGTTYIQRNTIDDIYTHLNSSLPRFAVPSFIRVVDALEYTGNNKLVKGGLRKTGVDVDKLGAVEDGSLWWLRGDRYEKFGKREWDEVCGGRAKL